MPRRLHQALGLPLACRQLKQETALLPYKLVTFNFNVPCGRRFDRIGHRLVEHVRYEQQHWELQSFLEKRSKEQIKALNRVYFRVFNEVNRKYEAIMESGAYWAKEFGCDGLLS